MAETYHPDHEASDLRIELDLMTADRDRVAEQRNRWIRLFTRLDAAVSRHRTAKQAWEDDLDEALHAAHDRILKEATGAS